MLRRGLLTSSEVYSDTVSLIKQSTSERTLLTHGTKRYPEFTQVLARLLHERIPAELKEGFTYTYIDISSYTETVITSDLYD